MTSPTDESAGPPGYRALFRIRELRALVVSYAALVAGSSLGGLALGTVVNTQTGSPLLTALALFGPTLANVIGAATLMAWADTDRPRRAMVVLQGLAGLLVLAQTVPGLSIPVRLALVIVLGLMMSVATGLRLGVLTEIVDADGYGPARSMMNIANGSMQVFGFGAGAVLLSRFTPRDLFLADALALGLSTMVVAVGVREHSARVGSRPSLRQTVATNTWLLRQRMLRPLLINLWVPNGLIVGCEALFIPYAGNNAGTLFMAGALGMLLGDFAMGRLVTRAQRSMLSPWLRVLLAAPYLAFVGSPPLALAGALVVLASAGFSATLALQERLVELVPAEVRGQVQGVEGAGRMTMQGVGALLAGALAEAAPAHIVMTVMAVASLLVTATSLRAVNRAFR